MTNSVTARGTYRNTRAALLGGALVITAAASGAQSPVKQVLVLQSLDRGSLVLDRFTGDFRVALDRRAGKPVNVIQVVVGQRGLVGGPEEAVVHYLLSLYANSPPPDLIVSTGGPAAAFVRRNRKHLFPATPLLLASVDQRWLSDTPLGENETAVPVVNDYPRMLDEILQILPETKQVFMVAGSGSLGSFWRRELETELARFRDHVNVVWSDELTLRDMLRRSTNLPAHSAIVFINFSTDVRGGAYADEQVLADLHSKANAPLFGPFSPLFGVGVVGGSMMSIPDLARTTADVATRILNGEPPASFRPAPRIAGPPMFDWRELQRWDIPESRLPPGSVVAYRAPTLWEEHKLAVQIATAALIFQSFLVALLLLERRSRQRAEIQSSENLSLAADVNRRDRISALSNSIGHELGQPLSAIVFNAQALQQMTAKHGAGPDESDQILSDIQSEAMVATQIIARHRAMLRSHQLHKKAIDFRTVIDETLSLVAHDVRSREIELTLDLSSTPCIIAGDQVLLGQVLVNLIQNAMDALAGSPSGKRHIAIRSIVRSSNVEISVSDTGSGLSKDIGDNLFTPFVTTKSHGLGIGLAIAQRIIEAHAGTIVANDNANGGATFIVTLPRATAADVRAPAEALRDALSGQSTQSRIS